jgi:hypothetical protein
VATLLGNVVSVSELDGETLTATIGGLTYVATIAADYQTTTKLEG